MARQADLGVLEETTTEQLSDLFTAIETEVLKGNTKHKLRTGLSWDCGCLGFVSVIKAGYNPHTTRKSKGLPHDCCVTVCCVEMLGTGLQRSPDNLSLYLLTKCYRPIYIRAAAGSFSCFCAAADPRE